MDTVRMNNLYLFFSKTAEHISTNFGLKSQLPFPKLQN